jgi:hypothetical protein
MKLVVMRRPAECSGHLSRASHFRHVADCAHLISLVEPLERERRVPRRKHGERATQILGVELGEDLGGVLRMEIANELDDLLGRLGKDTLEIGFQQRREAHAY